MAPELLIAASRRIGGETDEESERSQVNLDSALRKVTFRPLKLSLFSLHKRFLLWPERARMEQLKLSDATYRSSSHAAMRCLSLGVLAPNVKLSGAAAALAVRHRRTESRETRTNH